MTEDEPEPVRRGWEAMGRSVANFADPAEEWHLVLQCAGSCRVQRRLVAELVPYVPPSLTWAEVVPKLRCSQCGEQADIVGLSGRPKTPGGGSEWLLLQRGGMPHSLRSLAGAQARFDAGHGRHLHP